MSLLLPFLIFVGFMLEYFWGKSAKQFITRKRFVHAVIYRLTENVKKVVYLRNPITHFCGKFVLFYFFFFYTYRLDKYLLAQWLVAIQNGKCHSSGKNVTESWTSAATTTVRHRSVARQEMFKYEPINITNPSPGN